MNLTTIDTSYINYISVVHDAVLKNVTSFKKAQVADISDNS
jgi:hypothetical protein